MLPLPCGSLPITLGKQFAGWRSASNEKRNEKWNDPQKNHPTGGFQGNPQVHSMSPSLLIAAASSFACVFGWLPKAPPLKAKKWMPTPWLPYLPLKSPSPGEVNLLQTYIKPRNSKK